jgi:hypothetical protein
VKLLAPFLHFDQDTWLPYKIGKRRALPGSFLDAVFQRRSSFLVSRMTESLEQPVAKDLSFALLVALK